MFVFASLLSVALVSCLRGTYLARVKVQWDALKRRNGLLLLLRLLLVLLLALSSLVHCMLGLLVEWIGWRRLPWHVAGVQSNSLHKTDEASTLTTRRLGT